MTNPGQFPEEMDLDVPLTEMTAEEQLLVFSTVIRDIDSTRQILLLGVLFAEEGVNIWRVIRENEDLAEDILGVDLPQPPTEQMVEQFDNVDDLLDDADLDSVRDIARRSRDV